MGVSAGATEYDGRELFCGKRQKNELGRFGQAASRTLSKFRIGWDDEMKTCPLCAGTRKVGNATFTSIAQAKEIEIKNLRSKGLTFRQIAKTAEIKSTSTVNYYLTKQPT